MSDEPKNTPKPTHDESSDETQSALDAIEQIIGEPLSNHAKPNGADGISSDDRSPPTPTGTDAT